MIRTAAQITADIHHHDGDDLLTPEQRVLLGMVADGHTHAAIARRVEKTRASISDHLARIYRRLGARNAAHAVAIAHRAGLLPAPDPGAHQQ